ncbi:pentapeptide repeat-containing protein [Nocardia sp. NBC_01009]|uniref:pentapeptide repeat-containing protein n=1 Tax=Nocardia sp. NBC_01009 TaxID=2975996 RepID=UPI003867B1F9|nr:pentapeptide repeat-containing protein [Nocardia sp. NBC_01009]
MRWGRLGDRLHRAALLLAVVTVVVCGLAIAGLTWWLLWWALGAKAETPNQLDLTKIALSVAAGVGGAVALVVAYRRQRDLERGRFAELFGAAARQLGDADVAVRIAGVYAMAGVADEFSAPSRRQQCIDVLCGYLRLPFDLDEAADHLVSRAESTEAAGVKVERVYQFRQNDSEVRRTIVKVIADHLRRSTDISWSDRDFTFNRAVLEQADFRYAVFAGRHTSFARATFTGTTTFEHTTFAGSHVTFREATFRNGSALFDHAEFGSTRVEKNEVVGFGTTFDGTTFDCPASFESVTFRGPRTTFLGARFLGARTSFQEAKFRAERTSFERAALDGERITFAGAEFASARIAFTGTQFYAATIDFDDAQLGVSSRLRARGTRETDFTQAEFHGGVTFARATLGGRTVDFSDGDFFGDISFRTTRFAANEVRFEHPRAWVGAHFDWDDNPIRKPACVKPNPWPPAPVQPAAPTR